MITDKQAKALAILDTHPGITANAFAGFYFDSPEQEYLFTASSNQGNGACRGKKAWLCAGSLLGKLARAGLIKYDWGHKNKGPKRFFLNELGRRELTNYTENKNNLWVGA